jgi:hypothetical protein
MSNNSNALKSILRKLLNISFDIKLAIVLLILGSIIGTLYISSFKGTPQFYQSYFGPSVMLACGKGLVNPDLSQAEKLSDFLNLKQNKISHKDIPENIKVSKLFSQQNAIRYFLIVVGIIWSILGISWSSLFILYGLILGCVMVFSYGIFRFGMGRFFSVIGTLIFSLSSLQLNNLPNLRYYIKVPFILAIIFILGYIVTKQINKTRFILLAAICGATIGIGLGFRMDIYIMIPVCILTILLFNSFGIKNSILLKIVAVLIFLGSVIIFSWPVISYYSSGGSNIFHPFMLGFMPPFNDALGVQNTFYDTGYKYNDTFMGVTINSYASRIWDVKDVYLTTKAYDQIGLKYFIELIRNFPADFLIRFYGAILKIIELPYSNFKDPALQIDNVIILKAYKFMGVLLQKFSGSAIFTVTGTLLFVSRQSIRKAIFILFILLYLAGYPFLAFEERHYFQLEFIGLFSLLFILQRLILFIKAKTRINLGVIKNIKYLRVNHKKKLNIKMLIGKYKYNIQKVLTIKFLKTIWINNKRVRNMIFFTFGSLLILFGMLYTLRSYQSNHLDKLFKEYLSADVEKLKIEKVNLSNGAVLINEPNFASIKNLKDNSIHSEYMVVEFDSENDLTIPIRFTYESNTPYNDFSKSENISIKSGVTKVFFPIYFWNQINVNGTFSSFKGIEINEQFASCLKAMYRVKNSSKYNLLLDLNLPANWEDEKRYQTLGTNNVNDINIINGYNVITEPTNLIFEQARLMNVLFNGSKTFNIPINSNAISDYFTNKITFTNNSIIMNGTVNQQFSFLMKFNPVKVEEDRYLVVKGKLIKGGLSIGLLHDNTWYKYVNVQSKGDFIAIIEVKEKGDYYPMICNDTKSNGEKNNFIITDMGWISQSTEGFKESSIDDDKSPDKNIYTMPDKLLEDKPDTIANAKNFKAPIDKDIVSKVYSKIVTVDNNNISINGKVAGKYSYLAEFKPVEVNNNKLFILKGKINSGGLCFGLLKDNKWYKNLIVNKKGEFTLIIEVSENGTFIPMLTNATDLDSSQNDFTITDYGFINP